MKNRLAAFFMQKKEVLCMGYARKEVEKTKKIAKKFVRDVYKRQVLYPIPRFSAHPRTPNSL